MFKPIAIVKQDNELQTFMERIKVLEDHAEQRLQFLTKQADQLKEELWTFSKPIWKEISAHLVTQLPPDFTLEKYHFHFDENTDLLYFCDVDHRNQFNPLIEIIKNL